MNEREPPQTERRIIDKNVKYASTIRENHRRLIDININMPLLSVRITTRRFSSARPINKKHCRTK